MRDCSLLPNPHPIPIYPTDRDATKYCKWPCLFSTLLMHTSLAHTRGQSVSVHSCQNILNRKMRRLDLNFSAMFGEGKEKEDLWTIAGYVWCPESVQSLLPSSYYIQHLAFLLAPPPLSILAWLRSLAFACLSPPLLCSSPFHVACIKSRDDDFRRMSTRGEGDE